MPALLYGAPLSVGADQPEAYAQVGFDLLSIYARNLPYRRIGKQPLKLGSMAMVAREDQS